LSTAPSTKAGLGNSLLPFFLQEYPANWSELALPGFLGKDDADLECFSLQGEKKSLFDDLGSNFGCAKGDVVSGRKGRSVQSLNTWIGSGLGSGLASMPERGQRTPASAGSRSVPLGAGEKRQEGERRKGSRGPQSTPVILKKRTRS
ncbi:hypothetical protein AMTR_s00054p00139720, partial [Amborella trichopoda]